MPKNASIKPSAMGETIESMVAHESLPKRNGTEMEILDFHTVGIAAVAEAIRDKPIAGLDQRSLTRYATRVALNRMEESSVLQELRTDYREYLDKKKDRPQIERRRLDKMLWGLACGYEPFISERSVHVWFWDEQVKNAILSICTDSGVPKRLLYPFVADALSEIGSLGRVVDDLTEEYRHALLCLSMYSVALKSVLLNISHE